VAERGAPLRRENILQRENRVLVSMNGFSVVEGEFNGLLGLSDSQREESPESLGSAAGLDPIAENDNPGQATAARALEVQEIQRFQQSLDTPEVRRGIATLV